MYRKYIDKKYELMIDERIRVDGHILYRIKAFRDFSDVKCGDLGCYVEFEKNLSDNGGSWIYDNAMVFENACVAGNSKVRGNSKIYDHARIAGHADISENSVVCGCAHVHDTAKISGESRSFGYAQIFGSAHISGDAWVCGDIHIYGTIRLNAGCWNQYMVMDHREYLISTTLEKLELM